MNWSWLFHPRETPEEAAFQALVAAADDRIRELNGDLRNQAQAMQSHSRRLDTMARTMALLRDGVRG